MQPRAHQLAAQCRAMVVETLQSFPTGDAATERLTEGGFAQLVEELARENLSNLNQAKTANSFAVAVINEPAILHYCALASVSPQARDALIAAVADPLVRRHFPLADIWSTYADALVNFLRGQRKPLEMKKPRGYQKFIVPYIRFMLASEASEQKVCREQINDSFSRRNRDRRLIDWVGLDGDGKRPVQWDFRLYALERAG